jgi:magnesium transporter
MKPKIFLKKSKQVGLPPGEIVYNGDRDMTAAPATVQLMDYDDTRFDEKEILNIEDCFQCRDSRTVSWINVNGLHDTALIEKIGDQFGIHPMILEDVVSVDQRPKIEDMGHYIYFSMKMIFMKEDNRTLRTEQVSIILGNRFVISFQEPDGDVFDAIRDRIRTGRGRIRKMGSDYLAYSLLDAVVDHYFLVLESLGEEIENLEEEVLEDPSSKTIQKLHEMKRQLLFIRKSVWPVRELVNGMERSESDLIQANTHIYLRDVYDHTIQIIDMMETMRDMNAGLFDMYLSSLSNRLNEVMKVLTIIATIFIPLTFIAGVYGMNFQFMPELKWRWGYFYILGVMLTAGIFMLLYFKRKKWI